MTVEKLTKTHLKRELLNETINKLKHWVDTQLVWTDKVKVLIEPTGNDTVDDVSIQFNNPLENRPGCDTVFLALHYKDKDVGFEYVVDGKVVAKKEMEGDHLRLHHPNYGLFSEFCQDTWVKTVPKQHSDKGLFIAHHALLQLINVLEEIRDYCESGEGNYDHFDPRNTVFRYDLVLGAQESKKFNRILQYASVFKLRTILNILDGRY